jgi:tetratricopeptide (TPR) repeat protein
VARAADRAPAGAGRLATPGAAASRLDASWAEATCLLAGLVVPLAFHTLGTVGFEATKVLLVRLLALVLVLGWLAVEAGRIGSTPGPFAWRGALVTLWRGPLRLAVIGALGFAAATALATAASVAPTVSLLGSWDREQGLATTLAWLALGVAAALAGRDPSRRRHLLVVWSLGSLPVCLYAFLQYAHLDPVVWLNQPRGVSSTLGSSTALATYLAMVVPITVALAAGAADADSNPRPKSRSGRRRRVGRMPELLLGKHGRYAGWVAVVTAQLAALTMTEVRGGLLALAGGLLVMLAVALWPTRRRVVLVGGGLAVLGILTAGAVLAVVPRADVGDGPDTSARQRLLIWQDAVQALAGPRLLLGFGPETQVLALEPRYPVELALRFENARFDRAHNLVLDTLLTTGLLGLAALVVTVFGVARAAVVGSRAQPGPDRWLTAGLLGAMTANLAAGQFAFDTAATGALFWLAAGLAAAPLAPRAEVSAPLPVARSQRRRKRGEQRSEGLTPAVRLRATAMLAAGAIGLAAVPWLTAPFLADLYHTRALALRAGEAPGSSSRQELAAAQSVPWLDVPLLSLADVYLDIARTSTLTSSATISRFEDLYETSPSSRAALFEAARLTLERAAALNPLDPYPHAYLARHWMMRAEASRDPAEQADLYGKAVEAYDLAIAAGPSRVDLYDESGVALTRWGRPALALDRFRQAEALSRPAAERDARMADAVLAQGDAAAARALYEQALALDARSAPAEAGLAALDRAAGDLPSALEHAQRAARFQMRNWQYQRDLALTYRALGQSAEALAAARAARRLAPAWELDDLTALIQSVSG